MRLLLVETFGPALERLSGERLDLQLGAAFLGQVATLGFRRSSVNDPKTEFAFFGPR